MLFFTLGKLDLISVIIILGAAIFPKIFLFYAALYLIIKGCTFILISRDLASYGDLASGIYLIFVAKGITIPFIHGIVLFYLLQKTALTFLVIAIKTMVFYEDYKDYFLSFFGLES